MPPTAAAENVFPEPLKSSTTLGTGTREGALTQSSPGLGPGLDVRFQCGREGGRDKRSPSEIVDRDSANVVATAFAAALQ